MYTVYVLQNTLTGKHYIGSTGNIDRRIKEHNRGQTLSTRRAGVWVIIYQEEYNASIDAKRRERIIKSYKGGNAFKILVRR